MKNKNVFKLGAIVLTMFTAVVACDKDADVQDAALSNLIENEISFSEDADIGIPKGLENFAGKDASEFTHIFGTAQSQNLDIMSGANIVWSGSYTPGDIANSLVADEGHSLPILLPDGDYSVSTSNSGDSQDAVLGFLPYSSGANFSLPRTEVITLNVTHSRGFAIVNVEDALQGNRVTAASVDGTALQGPDAEGDYFGYLLPGNKLFAIDYDLNSVSTTVSGSMQINAGLAYTIDLTLEAEEVRGQRVVTSVGTSTEQAETLDVNNDQDMYDEISRTVTTTYVTIDGVDQASPTIEYGAWGVSRNLNNPSFGGDNANPGNGDYVERIYSDWAPAFGTQTESYEQTRVVSNAGASFDPNVPEEALSRQVVIAVSGGGTSTSFIYDGNSYTTLALAQAAADAAITGVQSVTIIERVSTAATLYVGSVDGVELGRHSIPGAADVDTNISYNTQAEETDAVDTVGAFSDWAGTAPAATFSVGAFGQWSGTAPAATISLGAFGDWSPENDADTSVATITQTRTASPVESVVAAYQETRTATVESVVASYTETRSRLITVNGNADADYSGSQYTDNGDGTFTETESRVVAEARTPVTATEANGGIETRQVAEVRTVVAATAENGGIETREIANPLYVAPVNPPAGWTLNAGVYSHSTLSGTYTEPAETTVPFLGTVFRTTVTYHDGTTEVFDGDDTADARSQAETAIAANQPSNG